MKTMFTCSNCDHQTGDPKYTENGFLCEDCVKECLYKGRDLFIDSDGSEHERCAFCDYEE